jgi:hypothetical protein
MADMNAAIDTLSDVARRRGRLELASEVMDIYLAELQGNGPNVASRIANAIIAHIRAEQANALSFAA